MLCCHSSFPLLCFPLSFPFLAVLRLLVLLNLPWHNRPRPPRITTLFSLSRRENTLAFFAEHHPIIAFRSCPRLLLARISLVLRNPLFHVGISPFPQLFPLLHCGAKLKYVPFGLLHHSQLVTTYYCTRSRNFHLFPTHERFLSGSASPCYHLVALTGYRITLCRHHRPAQRSIRRDPRSIPLRL
jgi:hypothetical protein